MTFKAKPKPPTLVDRLDTAAEALLASAFGGTKTDTEGPAVESDAPLPDKIKAFEAAVKWAGERSKLIPTSEKGNSKGERIRSEFHRRTSGSRAVQPDSEAEADDEPRPNGSA